MLLWTSAIHADEPVQVVGHEEVAVEVEVEAEAALPVAAPGAADDAVEDGDDDFQRDEEEEVVGGLRGDFGDEHRA
ncbi:MAG: hypothetical protein R3F43_00515 [bacterium]